MDPNEIIRNTDSGAFLGDLRAWEDKVFSQYERLISKKIIRDEHYQKVTRRSINMSKVLERLPRQDYLSLMAEYEGILGINKINQSDDLIGNGTLNRLLKKIDPDKRSPTRLNIDQSLLQGSKTHPLAMLLSRATPQLDEGTGKIRLGKNILRADYIEEVIKSSSRPMTAGSRVMVFDTETAGLLDTSGVHQVSWLNYEVGKGIDPRSAEDVHFRVTQMQRGMIATKNGTKTMEEAMGAQHGYVSAKPGEGAAFTKGLSKFLDQMESSDFIVGHNVEFDIGQIFNGLMSTSDYLDNKNGFAQRLDRVMASALQNGKIKDTLVISKMKMPGLELAPELDRLGKASTHSIENIMLQTNLFGLIKNDLGESGVNDLFQFDKGGSLHAADVDTYVTSRLLQALESDELTASPLGKTGLAQKMRSSVLRSQALTPVTKIADINLLDKGIFKRLLETQGEEDSLRVVDSRYADINAIISEAGTKDADSLYKYISDNDIAIDSRMTPLEQKMLLTRGKITADESTQDIGRAIFQQHRFRTFIGQNVTEGGALNADASLFKRGIFPSTGEYSKFQSSLRKSGTPFADLSMDERWFTHAMASAVNMAGSADPLIADKGGVGLTRSERIIAQITDDLGVSRFSAYDKAWVSDSGKFINLSPKLIEEAEQTGAIAKNLTDADKVTMLDYSTFRTGKGTDGVNLTYGLSEDESTKLGSFIRSRLDDEEFTSTYFKTREAAESVADLLPTVGSKGRIGIARLEGKAATAVSEAINSFNAGTTIDSAKIRMQAGYMGTNDRGVTQVGAWVSGKLQTPEFLEDYKRSMGLAQKRLTAFAEYADSRPYILKAAEKATDPTASKVIESVLRNYDKVGSRAPLALGAAAVMGAGYYLHKKHRDKEEFRATTDQMERESGSFGPLDEIAQAQVYSMRQGVDPLSTTGVVTGSYYNRIGHNKMGSNKNSELFSVR